MGDQFAGVKNRTRSSVGAKVEHSIGVTKLIFGFVTVRYRGVDKNVRRLFATCALANLYLVRRRLLRSPWRGRSAPVGRGDKRGR